MPLKRHVSFKERNKLTTALHPLAPCRYTCMVKLSGYMQGCLVNLSSPSVVFCESSCRLMVFIFSRRYRFSSQLPQVDKVDRVRVKPDGQLTHTRHSRSR